MEFFDTAKLMKTVRQLVLAGCLSFLFIGHVKSPLYTVLVPMVWFGLNYIEERTRCSWYVVLTAVLFGIMNTVGRQFDTSYTIDSMINSLRAIVRTGFLMIGHGTVAYMVLRIADTYMEETERLQLLAESAGNLWKLTRKYFCVFVFGWMPFLILNFPGHAMADTVIQLLMFNNIDNYKSQSVVLLDPNFFLTQHHTVAHTVLVGGLTALGRKLFGSDNIGFFMYTVLQYLMITACFAYAIAWLTKFCAGKKLRTVLFCFYFFTPFFVEYAIVATKDIISTGLLLIFTLMTFELLYLKEGKLGKGWTAAYVVDCLLNMLFRRNGFLILIFSFVFILIAAKKHRRQIAILILCLIVSQVGYSKAMIALKITPASDRVIYSVMYQQTARYVVSYPDEVTEEEKQAINGVMVYRKIQDKFDIVNVDKLMALNRRDATKEDRIAYLKAWLAMFKKHPMCYVQATLQIQNGTYSFGDYTPFNYHNTYARDNFERLEKYGFDLHFIQKLALPRHLIMKLMSRSRFLPGLSALFNAAFYNWIVVFLLLYAMVKRDMRLWTVLMPSFAILAMIILGPANSRYYFRYEFPIAVMLPIIIAVFLCVRTQERAAQGENRNGGCEQLPAEK